jgi:cell division septum initiation protein DivIVA
MLSEGPVGDGRSGANARQDDVRTSGEASLQPSRSAARLLEVTARETDQWRSEARHEATGLVAAARDEADALVGSAQQEVKRMIEAAEHEAARTIESARAAADDIRARARLEREREERALAHLRQVAATHEEQLRHHLTDMMNRLDSSPVLPHTSPDEG